MAFVVWGIGDAGERILSRMAQETIPGLRLVAVNTHPPKADSTGYEAFHIGESQQGAGGIVARGKKAVRHSAESIYAALTSFDHLILVGGFGGGTGTGALPEIAQMAQVLGLKTDVIVSMPFTFEGDHRAALAREGLQNLRAILPQAVIIEGDSITQWLNNPVMPTMQEVFSALDRFMAWNALARLV